MAVILLRCRPRHQGYYYYTRTEEGQQYAVHCRRAVTATAGPPAESDEPSVDQPEEIILDENKRKTEGKHTFYMVNGFVNSHDMVFPAYASGMCATV